MASVKIGDKNIALPLGMSEDELEKAIRKLKADFIKDSFKPPKPATTKKDGGMMKKNLKPVDKEKNPGLAKLPTEVRNKMGFMKDGGTVALTNRDPLPSKMAKKGKTQKELQEEERAKRNKEIADKLKVKKFMKDGGMVLEIGLRPATKKENKMAKEMMGKKPKKMAGGGMVARGTGAAIRGKGFKGVF